LNSRENCRSSLHGPSHTSGQHRIGAIRSRFERRASRSREAGGRRFRCGFARQASPHFRRDADTIAVRSRGGSARRFAQPPLAFRSGAWKTRRSGLRELPEWRCKLATVIKKIL
jgi:hypothetical protein